MECRSSIKSPKTDRFSSVPELHDQPLPNLKTGRSRSQADLESEVSEKSVKKPFVASVKPSGQNYINYLTVKEQQKMKKSRLQLLKTLDKQRHKFKKQWG